MTNICKICGDCDCLVNTEDVSFCGSCYSVEGGFICVEDWEFDDRFSVDENGNLYKNNFELEGVVGVEILFKDLT